MKNILLVTVFVFCAVNAVKANHSCNSLSAMDIAAVSEDTVIFDLSQVVINGAEVEFPVFISTGEDAFSLDFSMKFNLSKLQYDTTIVYPPELFNAANYNPNDQTLRFTSSSLDPIPNNVVLLTLKFHLLTGNHVSVNDFYNTSALTNGSDTEIKWITAVCTGESLILTAPQNPGYTYLWSTGETTASITVNTADTYYATVTQGGSSFLSDITEVIISQFPDGNVLTSGPLVFCDEDSVILGAVAAGNSYAWSNGATTQNIVVKSTGTYSVNVTSPYGCTTASAQSNVTVNPLPNTAVNINGPTAFCEGDSTILQAVQSGNQYLWSNGATTQSVTIKTGGTYTVQITNGFGCTDESTPIPITVNPLPVNTVSADGPLVFCAGESVNLTADATGSYTYLWSTGETSQFINVTVDGNYSVTTTDPIGCSSVSVPVSVVVDTLPEDFNGDGVVSSIDFLIFLGKFGSACTCLEDLNHDGFVTNVDFLTFLGKFGSSCN